MTTETKPRMTAAQYREWLETRKPTVGDVIRRYVKEMNGLRPLGLSHQLTLEKIAREEPIARVEAIAMDMSNVIDLCQRLRARKLNPATSGQYITYLSGALNYAGAAWADCKGVSGIAIVQAKPFLTKHGLIGKSTPRERRPSAEEIERLCAYFAVRQQHARAEIDMVAMTRWQVSSGRRVGESCKLLWEDWNREARTILVRKMKDPRNKNKQKWVALPLAAQAILEARYEARDQAEPRIYPFNSHSVSAAYTAAKHALGIDGLRLHDSRRECASALAELGYNSKQIAMVTGHETTAILDRTYNKPDPATFKEIRLAA